MTIRKRLSGILTPPTWLYTPGSAPDQGSDTPQPADQGPSLSEVGSLLKELLIPGQTPEQVTRERLGRLKEISAKYGALQVAREIRDTVQRMPEATPEGTPFKKNRGYDLASDLFLQHARKRLEGGDSKAALYDVVTVAEEIQACLFASDRHVKGIDLGLDLVESVLEHLCAGPQPKEEYLNTAQEILGRSLEAALAADEAKRAGRNAKKSEDDPPAAELFAVPGAVLEYLSTMSERLRKLRTRMGTLGAVESRARLDVLANLAEDAARVSLFGLSARALEEAAPLLATTDAQRSHAMRQHAFKLYEQGRTEASNVGLRFVAHRYAQGAARVES